MTTSKPRVDQGRGGRWRAPYRVASHVIAVIVLGGMAGSSSSGQPERAMASDDRAPQISADSQVRQAVDDAVAAARRELPIPAELRPTVAELRSDHAAVGRCDYSTGAHRLCRRGDVDSTRVLVALGDSHARAWIPALNQIARRAHLATYYLAKPGCTASRVTPHGGASPFVACAEWREWAIDRIRRLRPDFVLLASAMPPRVVAPRGAVVRKPARVAATLGRGLVATVAAIDHHVGEVWLAEDNPRLTRGPAPCLGSAGADLGDCANPPTRRFRLLSRAYHDAARHSAARFVRTRPWFCARGLCPAVVGSTVTHRDQGHITTTYAKRLSGVLQQAMGIR